MVLQGTHSSVVKKNMAASGDGDACQMKRKSAGSQMPRDCAAAHSRRACAATAEAPIPDGGVPPGESGSGMGSGASRTRGATAAVTSGKAAVSANTARGPHACTSEPEK